MNRSCRNPSHGEAPITRQLASKILGEFARQTREAQPAARPSQVLTEREREVLSLVAQGRTNREIGQALFLSENTIKYHLKSILAKLHLNNRAEAVAFALRSGLVNPPKDS